MPTLAEFNQIAILLPLSQAICGVMVTIFIAGVFMTWQRNNHHRDIAAMIFGIGVGLLSGVAVTFLFYLA